MERFKKAALIALFGAPLLIGAKLTNDTDGIGLGTQLTVNGEGYSSQSSRGSLTISAGADSFSEYPSRAVRDNAAILKRLRNALKKYGISERDISTGTYSFSKSQKRLGDDKRATEGFAVQQRLTIFVRDAEKAGPVLDVLVDAGATNLAVNNRYSHYHAQVAKGIQTKARAAAVADAQKKASDYADALGMRIKRVITVQDRGVRMTGGPAPVARSVAMDVGTKIDTSESAVAASVTIEFELERKGKKR